MTGASGVGKDTIRHAAMPHIDNLEFSISATTRERRAGEQDGVQYHFIDRPRFERMIEEDAFLEYADYVGDYYGTPAGPVEQALAEGRDVLLELELVGARQVKRRVPEAVMIFIAPPSLYELERRLRGRGTDSEDVIARRLLGARGEMRHVAEFDYVILNDVLEDAIGDLVAIVRASRLRYSRQRARHSRYFDFLEQD